MVTLADAIAQAIKGLQHEIRTPLVANHQPFVGGVGTIAESGMRGAVFLEQLGAAGIYPSATRVFADPASLIQNSQWHIALVFSPFKSITGQLCDELADSARATNVVDTVVRTPNGTLGVNTNTYAAMAAVRQGAAGQMPSRILIAGTGSSARSLGLGIKRESDSEFGVLGRSRDKAKRVVEDIGAGEVIDSAALFAPELIINATTVGESADGDLDFDLASAMVPGVSFFDLNNRFGTLQATAVSRGCIVQSGVFMSNVTHALRASLLV